MRSDKLDFGDQIIKRLKWCRKEKKKISHRALVNWIVKRNTTQIHGKKITEGEIELTISKLYRNNNITEKNGFLKLTPAKRWLKYPINQYSIAEAIKLTITDYFRRRNEKILNTLIKRPLKEYDVRRSSLSIRKRALINYISKQRRDFHPEVIEKTINEMIDDTTLLVNDPRELHSDEEDSEDPIPYYGDDGKLQLNKMKDMVFH